MKKTALLIFGWNRPHYMQLMLRTVSRNKKLDTFVYLDFCQEKHKTNLLVNLCKLYVPHAKIIIRQKRYGCQNNIDCARLQAFNNGYDRIIVLEDDFLISDNYFTLLQNALDWCQKNCPKICMVIGWTGHNNYKTYKNFKFEPYQLSFSRQHMLGYILSKNGWDKMYQPYYKKYMQLTKNCLIDYDACKLNQLKYFFRNLPVNIDKSQQWKQKFCNQGCYGQDRATVACMYAAGIHRANFNLSRLQYIGYIGLHANLKDSINFGWNNIRMYQSEQDFCQKDFKLSNQLRELCK